MSRSRQRSIVPGSCCTLAAFAILSAVTARVEGSTHDAHDIPVPALRTIRVGTEASGGATEVILEADGPLPAPLDGAVDGPPRIYLDLKGVRPGPVVRVGQADALVRRIRVALHSGNPLSSRVVIDLYKTSSYRIDASGLAQGRLIILIGGSSSVPAAAPSSAQAHARTTTQAPAAPATQAPATPAAQGPATPAAPLPVSPAAPQPRAGGGDVYAAQVSVALGRLQALRPVLASIDRRAEQPAGDLTAAAAEFDAVARVLSSIRAPASRQMMHGLLLRTCALGARASRMRLDSTGTGDSASEWNAASAAAGALMMLDRAASDLGYVAPK
jgi:hypothetical protein